LNSIPAIEERPVGSALTSFEIQEEEVLNRLIAVNPNKSCGPLTSFFRKLRTKGSCRQTGKLKLHHCSKKVTKAARAIITLSV
jgi:hypothetical protein